MAISLQSEYELQVQWAPGPVFSTLASPAAPTQHAAAAQPACVGRMGHF